MILALSGTTGFIGQALIKKIRERGWTLRVIDRDSFLMTDEKFLSEKIEGADAVINLAGAPVARKWTPENKKEILDSRVNTTLKISNAINQSRQKPSVFISTSAIGIYDSLKTHNETSCSYADSFLAKVCIAWEREATNAEPSTRVVIFRIGLVLGSDGGALAKMHKPFSIGLGAKIGNGKQPVSFIHIDDLINAMIFTLDTPSIIGIVNAVSPFPSNNAEFSDKLGKVLGQPVWLTIPAFAMKLIYSEGAQVLLEGQKVLPEKLLDAGFRFKYPTIQNALVRIYG
ncbi:MAG: TIGR01777 family oxidoreductase [Bacteroidota bacterium]